MNVSKFINLKDYPIDKSVIAREQLVKSIQNQLEHDGCAVLKGFLTIEAISALVKETTSLAHLAYRSFNRTNPYFTKDDPTLPKDDPRRRFFNRSNSFIPADNFSLSGSSRMIQNFPPFDPFIKDCLQQEALYRYADPLADVIINTAEAGEGFPWHFDTNSFTITLAIQMAD